MFEKMRALKTPSSDTLKKQNFDFVYQRAHFAFNTCEHGSFCRNIYRSDVSVLFLRNGGEWLVQMRPEWVLNESAKCIEFINNKKKRHCLSMLRRT